MSGETVTEFCVELRELCRRSTRSIVSLAAELKISRGHLYSILNGEIKRPPDFPRFVEPFVRACGGDDHDVAEWRRKHGVLERAYDERTRRSRTAAAKASGGIAVQTLSPVQVQGDEPTLESGDRPRYEYAQPPRPWVTLVGAGLVALLIAVVTGVVTAQFAGGDTGASRQPASTVIPDGASGSQLCPRPAPAPGQNLLDALPEASETGNTKHQYWWATSKRIQFADLASSGFAAAVRGTQSQRLDAIVVHSCVPLKTGAHYRLTFDARADQAVGVKVRVQSNVVNAWTPSLDRDIPIGPGSRSYQWDFLGAVTYPANEVIFQVGDNPDFHLNVSNVRLIQTSSN